MPYRCMYMRRWKLKRLNLRSSSLHAIEPDTFARAVCALEAVDFSKSPLTYQCSNLTTEQLNAMYGGITNDPEIDSKKLDLSGHNHRKEVTSDTLASAVCRLALEEGDLCGTSMKTEHLDVIFSDRSPVI